MGDNHTDTGAAGSGQALPAGTRLEEFVVERVLGVGGFGMTYLARDDRLGRQVVVKENLPQFCWREPSSLTVRPRHTTGGDVEDFAWSLENFEREAAMLASLDHPGIVRVLRSFEAFGTAYFIMPFVGGTALDVQIEHRKGKGKMFGEEDLKGLLWRVLDSLDYLHKRGIYHRDIKPGNLLITGEGVPVLIDFGSARQRLGERSMTVVESPGYTPFEQLQSRGNIGPWSDLYALGGTLYKAITFESPPKAADRVLDDPVVPLASRGDLQERYTAEFLRSIDRALAVDRKNRWQDAGQWREMLWGSNELGERAPEQVRPERVLEAVAVPVEQKQVARLEMHPDSRSRRSHTGAAGERNKKALVTVGCALAVVWIVLATLWMASGRGEQMAEKGEGIGIGLVIRTEEAEEQRAVEKRAEEQAAAEKRAEEQAAAEKRAEEQHAAEKRAEEQVPAEKRAAMLRIASVQQLLDGGVIIRELSPDGKLLEIDFSHAGRAAGELKLEELAPIAANVHTLDLGHTKIADTDLKALSEMANLRILYLQGTEITDSAISHLVGLKQLESLNLNLTQVSDAALPELKKMTSLKKIDLWLTKVTADGARNLASVLGADVIHMGE